MLRPAAAAAVIVAGAAAGGILAAVAGGGGGAPQARELPTPAERVVRSPARLRVDRLSLTPAAEGAPARLDVTVTNVGSGPASGVGYVLQDAEQVIAYEETPVLGPGERETRALSWAPALDDERPLRITIGDGNVRWVRHDFAAVTVAAPGAGFPAAGGAALGALGAGALVRAAARARSGAD